MPEFFVLDSTGAFKSGGGIGASLPNPLTIAKGGTGLIYIPKGNLLYADAIDSLAALEVDNDLGEAAYKIMCNLVYPGETPTGTGFADRPRWGNMNQDPMGLGFVQPTAFLTGGAKPQSAISTVGVTTLKSINDLTAISGSTAPLTALTDAAGTWGRYSTVGTNGIGWGMSVGQAWAEHVVTFGARFRFSSITDARFFFGLGLILGPMGAVGDNLPAVSSSYKFAGVRFSTVAGDTGFRTIYSTGVIQTEGDIICPVVANQVYIGFITVNTLYADITIADLNGNQYFRRISISGAMLSQGIAPQINLSSPSGTVRTLDVGAVWYNIGS